MRRHRELIGEFRAATRRGAILLAIVAAAGVADNSSAQQAPAAPPVLRPPDVRYEPTPMEVVHAMLRLAKVTPATLFTTWVRRRAHRDYRRAEIGARGVGIDIDPQRVREAGKARRPASQSARVKNVRDLFEAIISEATVVMLYLWT